MGAERDLYMRALRARWWLIVVIVFVAAGAARYFTAREPPVYRATASSTVVPSPALTETAELLRALETLERRTVMATFALLPGSREVRQEAAAALGIDGAELRHYRVSGSVVPSTNVIRIQVEGPDAIRASDVANAVAHVTGARAGQLYRLFALQPLDPSIPMRNPVHPNGKRNTVVAGILGLFLGLAVTVGVEAITSPAARADQRAGERQARVGAA